MKTSAESPQRFLSPPVEPTAPHSRTPSKATVTSANAASVGETNLATATTTTTTMGGGGGDRAFPLSASTPRRRPSFVDQQGPPPQLPTPRGSLQWPSAHRSFSSAAATRDSSCHSQTTDRATTTTGLNTSAVASLRGRAPSSTCHTPMSSRDGQSEHRASAVGSAAARRGHSLGPHPTAPPLVDVGDASSQGPPSASHSVYTTGLCTPRDTTAITNTNTAHGRHPSPFSAAGGSASISATVNISGRHVVSPAPPPLDDFEAKAQSLTREELEEGVAQMRGENVVLRTSVLRLRESLATLQEGLRANYADIERRQDSIANTLLRRLEATKRHRAKLMAHLRAVELEKVSQETKLQNTKQSIRELSRHLKREEHEIAERLQGRLEKLHAQREQLDRVLVEQTNSLQQLGQLVQEVEEMGLGDGPIESASVNTPAPTPRTTTPPAAAAAAASAASASSSAVVGGLTAADAPVNLSVPLQSFASLSQISAGAVGGVSPSHVHERSSSRISATSSTAPATTTAEVAYDPNAMIRYLEEEIAAAESLRSEALNKADQYVATRERLERRLKREKERKAEQATRTEALRKELRSASTAMNEKAALQETAMEMEVDRHLNSSRLGGDIISSASSACVTPKLRAVSAVASRGNSISPGAGGLLAAGPGAMEGEPRVPSDAFLLPSSSFHSATPASAAGGGGESQHGMAVVGGDNCAGHAASGAGPATAAAASSSAMRINTSMSRDETTASSEGTPHTTRLLVQDTSRMAAPRPATSAESTPRRTPLATPQLSMSHAPAA